MKPISAPIATITYAAFQLLLAQQRWPFWAIDSPALEPLLAYQPVSLTTLVRVLKSHYTYSDLYLFNPLHSAEQTGTIDWHCIPQVDAETSVNYIITRAVTQPFLGIAGSLDAAQRGEIMLLRPADDDMRLHVQG
ncbi:MAG: hypothetical protein H7Z42_02930 [Roseiflexaceae bacterium]|nr:hypothetical protein [Roseiflexaceae bacterium]